MYAWRARIGLINPTHRGKAFAFWYNRVPAGVEIVPTFIGFRSSDRQTFEQGFGRAMQLHALALQAMGIARVAIASCYCDEMNEAIVRYFRRFEIDAVPFGGFRSGGTEQDLYTTSLSALDAVGNAEVYRYCRDGFARLMRPVDGIYINGGGWDAVASVNELERDLGTRVVLAQAAELWLTLRLLSSRPVVEDCGALLREDHRPPAKSAKSA